MHRSLEKENDCKVQSKKVLAVWKKNFFSLESQSSSIINWSNSFFINRWRAVQFISEKSNSFREKRKRKKNVFHLSTRKKMSFFSFFLGVNVMGSQKKKIGKKMRVRKAVRDFKSRVSVRERDKKGVRERRERENQIFRWKQMKDTEKKIISLHTTY